MVAADLVAVAEEQRSAMPSELDLIRWRGKRVWVAGHRGMVGSALVRRLAREDCEILTVDRASARPAPPGATSSAWMADARPQAVFLAAAQGRRHPRQRHASRPISSTTIWRSQTNVIEAARRAGVEKLLFWARPASIRNSRRSRSPKTRC